MRTFIDDLIDFDDRRASLPGEHWFALSMGVLLLASAPRRETRLGQTLSLLAGAAMLVRAGSGRDGFARRIRPAKPDNVVLLPSRVTSN
ncbi:hypothetical protein BH09PSE6_BH09PSE6_20250 [soil metagenome]